MRWFVLLGLGIFAIAVAAGRSAEAAAGGGAVFRVVYLEAAAPDVGEAAAIFRAFAAATRRAPGNDGFEALQEIGRPSRFAMVEGWRDRAAQDTYDALPATVAFRNKLQPLLVGPFEIRTFQGLSIAGSTTQGGRGAVYAVTHVDVLPAHKDEAAGLVTALAAASRKLSGNLSFDVLVVDGHPNHFTLVQGWSDRKAFDASLMAASTRDFRQKITPLEGALYDERLYYALR